MSRIQAVVSRNASYVYHMLSVARVGYDNAYGEKYRQLHPSEDLQELQDHQLLLTVAGGKHCGQLYGLLIAAPAALDEDITVEEYYAYLARLFATQDLAETTKEYMPLLARMRERKAFGQDMKRPELHRYTEYNSEIQIIIQIMLRNSEIFIRKVWPEEQTLLEDYVKQFSQLLDGDMLAMQWEELTGLRYMWSSFQAVVCNSLLNGPQAIDIAEDKDVFQRSGAMPPLRDFISHEFGIYLLRTQLKEYFNMDDFSHWKPLESLAGYYNRLILGELPGWHGDERYLRFYEELRQAEPSLNAREMFIRAYQAKDQV